MIRFLPSHQIPSTRPNESSSNRNSFINFNVSVLKEETPFYVFEHFGFLSGREKNKFEKNDNLFRSENGIYVVPKFANSYISGEVTDTINLGTHTPWFPLYPINYLLALFGVRRGYTRAWILWFKNHSGPKWRLITMSN